MHGNGWTMEARWLQHGKIVRCTFRRVGSWLENTRSLHVSANIAATAVKMRTTWNAASWATPTATSSSFVSIDNTPKKRKKREKKKSYKRFFLHFRQFFYQTCTKSNLTNFQPNNGSPVSIIWNIRNRRSLPLCHALIQISVKKTRNYWCRAVGIIFHHDHQSFRWCH